MSGHSSPSSFAAAFIPPLVAAAAVLLAGKDAAPVAYIAGIWGTLIGADLL